MKHTWKKIGNCEINRKWNVVFEVVLGNRFVYIEVYPFHVLRIRQSSVFCFYYTYELYLSVNCILALGHLLEILYRNQIKSYQIEG